MKHLNKQTCLDCHFLCQALVDKGPTEKFRHDLFPRERREALKKRVAAGSASLDYDPTLACDWGEWKEYNRDVPRNRLEQLTKNRRDLCFFWPYHPGMTHETAKIKQERAEKLRQSRSTLILSIAALFIALLSPLATFLVFSTQQSSLQAMQTQNRFAVRPILHGQCNFTREPPRAYVGLFLVNYGTGVALIQNYTVYLDQKPIRPTNDHPLPQVFETLGLLKPDYRFAYAYQLPPAIRPGDDLLLAGIPPEEFSAQNRDILLAALPRLSIDIRYNSLYDEVFQELVACPLKPN